MKTLLKMVIVAGLFVVVSNAYAEAPHGHGPEAPIGGPKGGRLLENTQPQAEVFVEKDLSVTVTFYDAELKPVPAAEQTVTVIAEAVGQKTTLAFEKQGDVLVSKGVLPTERPINLVLRLQQTPDDKPRNFRFVYADGVCGVCQRAEYACICGH